METPSQVLATTTANGYLPAKTGKPSVLHAWLADLHAAPGVIETPDVEVNALRVGAAMFMASLHHSAAPLVGDLKPAAGAEEPRARADWGSGIVPSGVAVRTIGAQDHRHQPNMRNPMIASTPAKARLRLATLILCASRAPSGANKALPATTDATAGQYT